MLPLEKSNDLIVSESIRERQHLADEPRKDDRLLHISPASLLKFPGVSVKVKEGVFPWVSLHYGLTLKKLSLDPESSVIMALSNALFLQLR